MSIAHFGTRAATADTLFPLLWNAVAYLEIVCGLKVITSTSDKASPNQKLCRMHRTGEEVVYKAANPFAAEGRYLYFISDPPHLIKTLRNNLLSSRPGGTKCLWNNGHHLWWSHVCSVHRDDINRQLYRTKLTHEHVNLTPSSKMSVRLAAQVLSRSVGRVMQVFYGNDMQETAKFIIHCDRFFDCLNVRSLTEGAMKRKPDLLPYRSVDDDRFQFMREFLEYLSQWREAT